MFMYRAHPPPLPIVLTSEIKSKPSIEWDWGKNCHVSCIKIQPILTFLFLRILTKLLRSLNFFLKEHIFKDKNR